MSGRQLIKDGLSNGPNLYIVELCQGKCFSAFETMNLKTYFFLRVPFEVGCKCKCKFIIIVVTALSYPWYCLTTDQLFHRRATQTNETNIVFHEIISNHS